MQPIADFLANPTTRRLALTLLGPLVAIANKKFGLGLEPEVVITVIAGLASAVMASNWKEASLAKSDAAATAKAAEPRTAEQDAAVLAGGK